MTRTELLSLAEQCPPEAAAILRKLAELRPVACVLEFGAVSLPHGHPSRITGMSLHYATDDAKKAAEDCDFDHRIFSVYQLSEVLTDE